MLDILDYYITLISDFVCGYPLFFLLIGGGLFLFIYSGAVSLRRLPCAISALKAKSDSKNGQISSAEALASVVAATVGMGNIAGVAIALVLGGPGAIFWMWVSAIVGMCTKYHEGVLAIMYRGKDSNGTVQGGPMYILERGLGRKWKPLAVFFAVAGMFGTLCIMNANQLTEAVVTTFTTPEWISSSSILASVSGFTGLNNELSFRLLFGILMASIVAVVVLGGIKRIATIASKLVPFMVSFYFILVLYIIINNISDVPAVFGSIFSEAFNLDAGIGALAGIAIIGARRAALVNDAGIGTASMMHGASKNSEPVREGLVAMLGPSIDSGLVCTLTALAILLCGDISVEGVKGLEIAMKAFRGAIPFGDYLLMVVVLCFAFSSMFTYSYYGTKCANYLFGARYAQYYTYFFILTLILFAVVPLKAAMGLCDLFYGLMAFPSMIAIVALSPKVKAATKEYFARKS
ncbi:MAG: alanine/glycine:cation symporter family protein [Muribaculaceae bacterium]|nr:alanine/glycine:cation symporter family protein [Muribaculaceae bacterium]